MNGESERGRGRGASVASQALVPGEAPMSTLGSGGDWRGCCNCVICSRCRSPGQGDGRDQHLSKGGSFPNHGGVEGTDWGEIWIVNNDPLTVSVLIRAPPRVRE
jgi:hypothetical protein